MSFYFTEYTLAENEDAEISEQFIAIAEEAVNEAVRRGAHQFKLWLSESDRTIYASVSAVVKCANHDLGKYFVSNDLWTGENR